MKRENASKVGLRMEVRLLLAVALGSLVFAAVAEIALTRIFERKGLEIAVSSLVLALCASVGIVTSWIELKNLTRPLRAIESAIKAFSAGASEEEAEGKLPKAAPIELSFIAIEVGDLMQKVRGWRKGLESQVASRTLELEFRNALLRAINASEDDEAAYASVIASILDFFAADAVLFAYYDGSRILRALVSSPGAASRGDRATEASTLGSGDVKLLEQAASGAGAELPLLGADIRQGIALGLEAQGEQSGYVAVGRKVQPFSPEERGLFSQVFAAFAIQVRMRKQKARQDRVRQETEHALRRSEERLRTFFDESKDMIYSSNADDVVASINAAGLALLGVADRFEVLGRPFADYLMSPEDRHLFLAKLQEQGFATDYECIFKRKDGSTLFCIETARAVKDKDGRIIEVQGIVKDISERIANERELWKTNLELAEANAQLKSTQMIMVQHEKLASIGQLAAGIAHEINNPLGFLKSNQATMSDFLKTMRMAWTEAAEADPAGPTSIMSSRRREPSSASPTRASSASPTS